jgi:hypothetical protein
LKECGSLIPRARQRFPIDFLPFTSINGITECLFCNLIPFRILPTREVFLPSEVTLKQSEITDPTRELKVIFRICDVRDDCRRCPFDISAAFTRLKLLEHFMPSPSGARYMIWMNWKWSWNTTVHSLTRLPSHCPNWIWKMLLSLCPLWITFLTALFLYFFLPFVLFWNLLNGESYIPSRVCTWYIPVAL